MKSIIVASLIFYGLGLAKSDQLQCTHKEPDVPKDWLDMTNPCIKSMRNQIQEELKAAMQYLAMGAHFSRDTINRPGFAKLFFEAASEERGHAIKLIAYLLMRGELTSSVSNLISKYIDVNKVEWTSGVEALRDALQLEASVTKKIKHVIKVCEDEPTANDWHLVDYLTGEFLEEQYKGQREIAGQVSTLDKFMDQHGALGEFLYDKKLLEA